MRHCGTIRTFGYGTAAVAAFVSPIRPSHTTSPPAYARIGGYAAPAARTAPITPRSSKTSSVRGWRPLPREPVRKRSAIRMLTR